MISNRFGEQFSHHCGDRIRQYTNETLQADLIRCVQSNSTTCEVPGDSCFVAGTPVQIGAHRSRLIETILIGERVYTYSDFERNVLRRPKTSDQFSGAALWIIRLRLDNPNGSHLECVLIRSVDWLSAHGIWSDVDMVKVETTVYENGDCVDRYDQLSLLSSIRPALKSVATKVSGETETTIYEPIETTSQQQASSVCKMNWFNVPEMGVVGEAEVLSIDPCPPLEQGPGGLVTGTICHTYGEVYDLKLETESEPIGVTGGHPVWSMDREDWVSVADLYMGESCKSLNGTTVVESVNKRPNPETVYNIEVQGDHVYRVGEYGLLVHDASASFQVLTDR